MQSMISLEMGIIFYSVLGELTESCYLIVCVRPVFGFQSNGYSNSKPVRYIVWKIGLHVDLIKKKKYTVGTCVDVL